jgi:predicted transcriptional regulator
MARSEPLPPLTEGQLEIMSVVWGRGEATVGEIWTELSRRRKVARNTVQTMVVRLADKGWLKHRAQGNTFYYRAVQHKDAARRRIVRRLVETLFHGSTEGLVLALLDDDKLTKQEAEQIRALIGKASGRKS